MIPDKPQMHWSKVASYLFCGAAFERAERGEFIPPGVASIHGSGVHKGNELDFLHKIETGHLLPDDAVQDATRDAVNDIWGARGARLLPDEKTIGIKTIRGQTVDSAIRLVTRYHVKIAPTIEPARVERPWKIKLKNHAYDLAGKIDLDEKIPRIRDWKVRGQTPPEWTADRSLQLTTYAMAKKVLDGVIPDVALDFLIPLKREPKLLSFESKRTDRHFKTLLNILTVVFDGMKKGVFTPAHPDHWRCDPRYCGYWDTCKYTHHY